MSWIAPRWNACTNEVLRPPTVKTYRDAVKQYVPPAPVPIQGPAGNAAEWSKVYGPGSNWGMG